MAKPRCSHVSNGRLLRGSGQSRLDGRLGPWPTRWMRRLSSRAGRVTTCPICYIYFILDAGLTVKLPAREYTKPGILGVSSELLPTDYFSRSAQPAAAKMTVSAIAATD